MAASLTSPQAGDLPASCLHTLHYDSIIADACAYNRRLFKGRESRPPFFDLATQITQRPAPWLQRNSQGGLKRFSASRSHFVLVYRRHRWRLQPRRPASKQRTRLVDGIALDSSQLLLMFPQVNFSGAQSKSGASEPAAGGRCAPKSQALPQEPAKQQPNSAAIFYDPEASLHGSASGDGSCLSSATQNSTSNSASSYLDRRFVGDQSFAGSKLLTDGGFVASRRADYRCPEQQQPQQQPSFDEQQQQQRFRAYPPAAGGDPSQQTVGGGGAYYLNGDKMRLRGEQGTNYTATMARQVTGYESGKMKVGKKKSLGDRVGQKPCGKAIGDFGQVGRRESRSKSDNCRYADCNRHGLSVDSENFENDSQDSCAMSEETIYRSNAVLPPRPPPLPPPGSPQESPSGLMNANLDRGLVYGSRDLRGGTLAQPPPRFSEGFMGTQPRMPMTDSRIEMSPSRSDNSSLDGLRWRSNAEDCNPSFHKANIKTSVTLGSGVPSVSLENTPCSMFNEPNASPVSSGGRSAHSNHPCGLTYSPSPRSSVGGVGGAPTAPQKLSYGKRGSSKATMPLTGATPTSPPAVLPPPGMSGNSCLPGGGLQQEQGQQDQQATSIDGQGAQTDSSATTMVTFFVCEVCASRYRSTAGLRYHYHSQHAGYTPRNPISASASRITIPMHEYNRYGPATGLRGARNSRSKRNRCNNNYVCHRGGGTSSHKSRPPPMNGGPDSQRGSSETSGLRGLSDPDLYKMPNDSIPEDHRPRSLYSSGSGGADRSTTDSNSFLSSLKLSTSTDLDYTRRQSPSFSHSPMTAAAPEAQLKPSFAGQHFSALPDTSVSSCSSSSSCSALASMDHMASSLLQQQQQQQNQSSGPLTQLQSTNFAKAARSGSPKDQHTGRAFTDSLSALGSTTATSSYASDTFKLLHSIKPDRGGQQLAGASPICGAQLSPEDSAVSQYQSSMPPFLADYYMSSEAFSGGGGGTGMPMGHHHHQRPPQPPSTYGPAAVAGGGQSSFLEFRNMMRQRRQLQYPPNMSDMFPACGYCQMRVEPSDPDSYARCFSCGVSVHTVCALRFRGPPPPPRRGGGSGINPLHSYPWLCVECKTCWICGSGLNEDHLISCNECDRGFHVYCLTAATSARQPSSLFTDDWVCEVCQPQNGCLRLSQ